MARMTVKLPPHVQLGSGTTHQAVRPIVDWLRDDKRPDHRSLMREAADEIERLRTALTTAANRLELIVLDQPSGSTRRDIADDWAREARDAVLGLR